MRALLVTAVVLTALSVAVTVSGAAVTVDAEKPRRRLRPAKILPAVQRFKPVTVAKGDPRAQDNAPVTAPPAAVPVVPAAPAVINKVVPSPPTTDVPQRPASPTAFWPAAPSVLNAPIAAAEQVVAKAAAAAQVGPVKKSNPAMYAATFQTMDGMPMISNDPNAVESDALLRRDTLEAKAVPNPTVVTVVQQPLPANTPAVVPGTAPLNPRRTIGGLKSGAPGANPATSAPAAAATTPVPATTRVLKLGATAGDNPCVRQGGQCQDSSTCGGIVTRLLCPGPPAIACCTYTTPQCAALGGSCRDQGTCQGDMKPGLCGTNDAVGCCVTGVPGWQGPLLPNKVAGNCLANFNPTAFADRARKFLKDYTDESPDAIKAAEMAAALGLDARVTSKEPASLVTTVLDTLGWGCPFNAATGSTIASIVEVVKTRGGLHPYPKVGDVALWTAHTGIVVELCVGGRLDMVTMSPAAATDKPQTNMRSTGCVPLQTLATANPGSAFLGFWTPQ